MPSPDEEGDDEPPPSVVRLVLKGQQPTHDSTPAPLPLRSTVVRVRASDVLHGGAEARCASLIVALFVFGGLLILFAWGAVFTCVHTAAHNGRLDAADDLWSLLYW